MVVRLLSCRLARDLLVRLVLGSALTSGCAAAPPLDTSPPGRRGLPYVAPLKYAIPEGALDATRGPLGLFPSVAIINGPRNGPNDAMGWVDYDVNGFPMAHQGCTRANQGPGSYVGIALLCPIHPYFLKRGDNRIDARTDGSDLSITRWDYLHSKSNVELTKVGRAQSAAFALDIALPEWPWIHGHPIGNTPENLVAVRAEVEKLHHALSHMAHGGGTEASPSAFADGARASTAAFIHASELRGKRYQFLDELVAAAEGLPIGTRPANSVALAPVPTDVKLEVFAGGTLAHLTNEREDPMIAFDSTYDDGPWGAKGGTIVGADPWFRQDAAGHWALDAVFPVCSTSISRAETDGVEEGDLTDLFQRSPF